MPTPLAFGFADIQRRFDYCRQRPSADSPILGYLAAAYYSSENRSTRFRHTAVCTPIFNPDAADAWRGRTCDTVRGNEHDGSLYIIVYMPLLFGGAITESLQPTAGEGAYVRCLVYDANGDSMDGAEVPTDPQFGAAIHLASEDLDAPPAGCDLMWYVNRGARTEMLACCSSTF